MVLANADVLLPHSAQPIAPTAGQAYQTFDGKEEESAGIAVGGGAESDAPNRGVWALQYIRPMMAGGGGAVNRIRLQGSMCAGSVWFHNFGVGVGSSRFLEL